MLLRDMLDERLIQFHMELLKIKKMQIYKISELMFQAGKVTNQEQYRQAVFEREKEFATGIGNGIAIPHCQSDCVKKQLLL